MLVALFLFVAVSPAALEASSLVVPDDAATIQQAIDAGPDTVLIRPGEYDEVPVVGRQILLVGLGRGWDDRPTLQGLGLSQVDQLIVFRRLVVTDPVVFGAHRPAATSGLSHSQNNCITFDACALHAGVIDSTEFVDAQCVIFNNCQIEENVILRLQSYCEMESCTVVHGGLRIRADGPQVVVRDCEFTANGAFFGVFTGDECATLVERTTVRGYELGISAVGEGGAIVRSSVVEDCGTGIRVGMHTVEVTNNVVRRCDTGIFSETDNSADISGNIIEHCSSTGMFVQDAGGIHTHVIGNLIHDSGSHGLIVSGDAEDPVNDLAVERNTLARNGGNGLLWSVPIISGTGTATIRANIAYANVGNGILAETHEVTTLECNDWSDNVSGNVLGLPASPRDLSINPGFCDEAADDFHLLATSPIANNGDCGQIGALSVGCVATEVAGSILKAERTANGISIWWTYSSSAGEQVWLERSDHGAEGPWSRPITTQSRQEDFLVELDQSVEPSREYWYRIVALGNGGPVVLGQPAVVAANPARFALSPLKPNPSPGPVSIEFALPSAASIRIDVIDLQGRIVETPAEGLWPAGKHQVAWRALHPAGVYLVRYRYPGGHLDRRLTLVR